MTNSVRTVKDPSKAENLHSFSRQEQQRRAAGHSPLSLKDLSEKAPEVLATI